MYVIEARNVNDALTQGVNLLLEGGDTESSRAGGVLVCPYPVTTVYLKPMERVLLSAVRDANPFFHLGEAMFLIQGRNDATWLDQFVHDYSSRFAEPDGHQHGAYGFRWRKHFDLEGGGHSSLPDQLETVIRMLKQNNKDRRVVLQMWDPTSDLDRPELRDVPCNLAVIPRIVNGRLDISVCCRSNDLILGCAGTNAVCFAILQEYMAARIGVHVGVYYQISLNYHAYLESYNKLVDGILKEPEREYPPITTIVSCGDNFDQDLNVFMERKGEYSGTNPFFPDVAEPLFRAHQLWKGKFPQAAMECLDSAAQQTDWIIAAREWMQRRIDKRAKQNESK